MDWVDRAALLDMLEADPGHSQLEERRSQVERQGQAATRLQKLARQRLGSAAPEPGRDRLGRAAANTAANTAAAVESAAVDMAAVVDMAADMGCMHFYSHIPTRHQN